MKSLFRQWIRGRRSAVRRTPRRGLARAALRKFFRPVVESLEDRTLLNAVSWISSNSGFWDIASNWSTGQVPTAADDVTINQPGVTVTVRDVEAAGTLSGSDALSIGSGGLLNIGAASMFGGDVSLAAGGALTVAASTTLNGHLNNAGTLNVGAGTLTVSGPVNQVSGTSLTGGTWNVANGATLNLASAPNLTTNAATVSLSGTAVFPQLASITTDSGSLSLQNGANFSAGGDFTISGSLSDDTGQFNLNNHQLTISSGGTLSLGNASGLTGASQVNNAGTFQVSAGMGTMSIGTFNNQGGTIDVESGTLQTPVGTSTGGTFLIKPQAVYEPAVNGGGVVWTGAYTGSGGGTVLFTNPFGDDTLEIGTSSTDTATFDFPQGMFQFQAGSIIGPGTLINAPGGFLSFTSSGSATDLGNNNPVVLDNQGTILHTGTGQLTFGIGAVLHNEPTGVYDFQAAGSFGGNNGFNSRGTVNNQGTVEMSGSGTSQILIAFNNQGATIDVESGTLQTSGGTFTGGTFLVKPQAVYEPAAQGATTIWTGTFTGSGGGAVLFTPIFPGNGTIQIGTSSSDTATFDFPAGLFQWQGGNIVGPGTLTNAQGGFLSITGSPSFAMDLGDNNPILLDNAGTILHTGTGTLVFGIGAVLNNEPTGVYNFQAAAAFGGNNGFNNRGTVNNQGTFEMSAASGTSQIPIAFNNQGGTIDVESGTLQTSGGTFTGGTFIVKPQAVYEPAAQGATTIWTGTFTGSGGGAVLFTPIFPGPGTIQIGTRSTDITTFAFPTGLFQWQGGNIAGPGTLTNSGDMQVVGNGSSNSLTNGATLVNTGTMTLNMPNGGVLSGDSKSQLINRGTVHWINGELSASFLNDRNATLSLEGDAQKLIDGNNTIDNRGTIDQSGNGNLSLGNAGPFGLSPGALTNEAGGVYDLQGGGDIHGALGDGTITNAGTFIKSGATSTTNINVGTVTNTGTIEVDTGTLSVSVDTSTGGTFTVGQGTVLNLTANLTSTGTAFHVAANATANVGQGTYTGETFTVAADGTVNLSPGTYAGSFTGAGTVNFSGMAIGVGGVSTDLGNFVWTGGSINSSLGDLTNLGTMTLTGSSEHELVNDGTLFNEGIIIQSGSGNLGLHSDNRFPTTLNNEAGAVYDIQADSGIDNPAGGQTAVVNAGIIQKAAGTGTSTLFVNGSLANTGTIEADTGTLSLSATISQLSGTTLTAGTWKALNGATLALPGGSTIATNQATITLSGAGATLGGLGALAANAGTLTFTNGAGLTTAGNLANTGTLTLGPGSKLTVHGTYTQGAAATLQVQLGGTPGSGQFGQLSAAGAATLGGTLQVLLTNGYAPAAGDRFQVVTFASATGTFAAVNNPLFHGGNLFQVQTNPTNITVAAATVVADLAVIGDTLLTSSAQPGQAVMVNYQVQNIGQATPVSSWIDSIFLTTGTTLDASAVLLGHVPHMGVVAANGQYAGTLTAPLPLLLPGTYHVLVEVDSRGLVPDANRANNLLAAPTTLQASLPTLPLSPPGITPTPVTGTITNAEQLVFQITIPANSVVQLTADTGAAGSAELLVGFGAIPSEGAALAQAFAPAQGRQQLTLTATQAGTYYVVLVGQPTAGTGTSFRLTAQQLGFLLATVSPGSAGNTGSVTLKITGGALAPTDTFKLLGPGGRSVSASTTQVPDGATALVTFNLAGAAVGTYDLQATSPTGQVTVLPRSVAVQSGQAATLLIQVQVPAAQRVGRAVNADILYQNTSNVDMPAPLLIVSGSDPNVKLSLTGQANLGSGPVYLMGISLDGPAGILRPGEMVQIPFIEASPSEGKEPDGDDDDNGAGVPQDFVNVALKTADSPDLVDYAALSRALGLALTDPVMQAIQRDAGPTWGGLVRLLDQAATNAAAEGDQIHSTADVFGQLIEDETRNVKGGVSGQLFLNNTGHPLGGALVTLATADGAQADSVLSLSDGTFKFPQIPAGTYNLTVAGYLLAQPVQVTVPAGGVVSGLSVTVALGGTIRGKVLQAGIGKLLGNIQVTAVSNQNLSYTTETASDGTYQLTGLPDGTYIVTASGGSFDSQTSAPETVVNATNIGGVDLMLDLGATIRGSVIAAQSRTPVAQATVLLVDANGTPFTATTDSSGNYTISNLHPGTYIITAAANGFGPTAPAVTTISAGSTTIEPTLALTAAASLTLTLENPTNTPIAAVGVDLTQNGVLVAGGETDATGNVTLTGLAAGTYQIQTKAFPFLSPNASITIQAGDHLNRTLVLQPGGTIQGQVTDGSGQPLANVPITVLGQNGLTVPTATASDGTYTVQGLTPGTFAITVGIAPGLKRQDLTLSASNLQATVNFVLAGAILRGTVVQGNGQTPVTNAPVFLERNGVPVITAQTDAGGNYRFEGVAPGTYTIQTDQKAGFASSSSFVVGTGNMTIPSIQEGGVQLTGTVQDPTGRPVAGATIFVAPAALRLAVIGITAITAGDGSFTIAGLAAGSYVVGVQQAGFAVQEQTVTLSGGSGPLALHLQVGTSLSGTVRDAGSGAAVADALVEVVSEATHRVVAVAQTDAHGSYQVPNLAAGTDDLIVADPSHSIAELFGLMIAASPVTQDVALQAETTSLQGTVTDGQGNPVANTTVLVLDSQGNLVLSTTTNFVGAYTTSALPAGTFTVEARAEGYAPAVQNGIRLQNGQNTTGINLAMTPVGVDDTPFEFLTKFQNAANSFSGFLFNPLLSGLDPSKLPSPNDLPQSEPLRRDVINDAANHTACPSELAALDRLNAAEDALDNQHTKYEQDFEKFRNGLGNALNTFLTDLGNAFLGANPALGGLLGEVEYLENESGAIIGLAGMWGGASQKGLAAEKFFSEAKPALDDVFGFAQQISNQVQGNDPAFNNLTAVQKLNALVDGVNTMITDISPVLDLAQNVARNTEALGAVNDVLGVVSIFTDLLHNAVQSMNDFFTVQGDQQAYQADINAYLAALHGLSKAIADCHNPPPPQNPPPPPNPSPGGSGKTDADQGHDPNSITGPSGFGPQGFVAAAFSLPYRIDFENLPTASGAAGVVTVTEQLDPNLDWNTFQLGQMGFGNQVIDVPAGRLSFSTIVNLPAGTPGVGPQGLEVQITAGINPQTGLVTWTFTSIDPTTQDVPIDPSQGFLPPDVTAPEGEGFVSYTIQPRAGVASGTRINAQATVVFDVNPPLNTAPIFNTIDALPPASHVNPLPAVTQAPSFTVSWSGQDAPGGSGIAYFDVFVSTDGGAFQPFLSHTTQTSATFTGAFGHTYGFYSVATDNVGNREATPTTAQATTIIGPAVRPLALENVFVIGLDGQVYAHKFDVHGRPAGGYFLTQIGRVKSLVVGHTPDDNPELFVMGLDDQVYAQKFDANGNSASGYFLVQIGQVKAVTVGYTADGNPELFVIGLDDQVYAQKLDANGNPVGGYFLVQIGRIKQLTVGEDAANHPEIFVRGLDDQVYAQKLDAAGNPAGGYFLTQIGRVKDLSVTHDAANRPELFVIGLDNQVYGQKFDAAGNSASGYFLTQPGQVKALNASHDAAGDPELFVIGLDDQVYAQKLDASGSPSGGYFLTQQGRVKFLDTGVDATGDPELFVTGLDDQVWAQLFNDSGFSLGSYFLTDEGRVETLSTVLQE